MLLNKSRSRSWDDFLTEDRISILNEIESAIGENYTPRKEHILRFMDNDLKKLRICIIGQDPYHSIADGELVANGRAFQPMNLLNWSQKFRQVSLKNMVRLLHKTYNDIENYEEIYKFKEVLSEIENGTFTIKQPREWFDSVEQQGVLFVNRYLSTEIGKANAQRKIWGDFMLEVYRYIDEQCPDMVWILWGKEAISCSDVIRNGRIIHSRHPMMCSNKYEDDFLKSSCFKETMNLINWLG